METTALLVLKLTAPLLHQGIVNGGGNVDPEKLTEGRLEFVGQVIYSGKIKMEQFYLMRHLFCFLPESQVVKLEFYTLIFWYIVTNIHINFYILINSYYSSQ